MPKRNQKKVINKPEHSRKRTHKEAFGNQKRSSSKINKKHKNKNNSNVKNFKYA